MRLLLVGALAVALVTPDRTLTGDDATDRSVAALHIVWDGGEVRGTSVLVRREDRSNDVLLYFLTSSHLFTTSDGERILRARAVNLVIDEGRTLAVKREDVFAPDAILVDVAILRVATTSTTLLPRPIVYDPPSMGDGFLVSGYDQTGAPATVAERIRFKSTRLVVGDRDASGLLGCLGAPAIS